LDADRKGRRKVKGREMVAGAELSRNSSDADGNSSLFFSI
jgi:hypothetical protein